MNPHDSSRDASGHRTDPASGSGSGSGSASAAGPDQPQPAQTSRQRLWGGLGVVGTLGWVIVVPTVGGAWGGRLIDRALDTGVACTLGGLVLGLAAGGYGAWRFYLRGLW